MAMSKVKHLKNVFETGEKTSMPFNQKVTVISRHTYNLAFGKDDRTFAINLSLQKGYYIVTNDYVNIM